MVGGQGPGTFRPRPPESGHAIFGTMAQPTTEKGRRSRERIVEAAAELMHRQGVAATSVDEVLSRAGAGKGQFYHYFRDKDDLVRAVLDHRAREALRELAPFLQRLDRWDGIQDWFREVVAMQEARGFSGGCPIGSIAAERAEGAPALRSEMEAALRVKGELLRQGLETMKARGELRESADPAALADFVSAVLQGALLMASVRKKKAALEASLAEAYRHLRSYAVDSPPEPVPGG